MKFKVVFLKKKYIYFTVFILILIIMFIFFLKTKQTMATINTVNNNKTIKADFTGDGIEDILYINNNKDKYFIEVSTKDNSIALKPNKKLNSLGCYYPYWPMRITLMDVSRDKVPEIFIQSSQNGTPIQHVFLWQNDDFKDVFFSSNNILGFIDSRNNKTPKFLSGTINDNKINLSNYILIKDTFKSYSYKHKDNYIGIDTIYAFIKYIEGFPTSEPNKPKDIFSQDISGNDISTIGKLAAENNTYTFQDATFTDVKYDKDNEISEIKWLINFKGTSNIDKTICKNYNLKLLTKSCLEPNENYYFKIASLNLQ